jgi:hypothetical protein
MVKSSCFFYTSLFSETCCKKAQVIAWAFFLHFRITNGTITNMNDLLGVLWKPVFLTVYSKTGNLSHSARVAGVSLRLVKDELAGDQPFREMANDARDEAIDLLEMEARRRALDGSDTLMKFILSAERPEKFRQMEVRNTVNLVKTYVAVSPDDWDEPQQQIEGSTVVELEGGADVGEIIERSSVGANSVRSE